MYDALWESLYSSRAWGRYPAEELIRFVAREAFSLPDRSALKALEVGCGPGSNLWFMALEGIAFDAIEWSPSAVSQARRRLDQEVPGWRGRIVAGDLRRLPEDFTGYDFVIDSQALSCNAWDDTVAVIADIGKRLRPGGAFWSRTFSPDTWGAGTGEQLAPHFGHVLVGPLAGKGPMRFTPRDDIAALYGDQWESLQVGEITRHDGNPDEVIREWVITARKAK